MASIFKRSKKKGEAYRIQYVDENGDRVSVKGFTDKGLTQELASKLETEARMRRLGLVDTAAEKAAGNRNSELQPHIDAFRESITHRSKQYQIHIKGRLKKIVEQCGFKKLGDIEAEAVLRGVRAIAAAENLGARTHNHYVEAMVVFCAWCVETKRLAVSPMAGAERLNTEVDIRHKRRALSEDEVARLIQSARDSGSEKIEGFNGEQRSRIYILSYMTGLRRSEIASLTPRSFDLDADPPTVTVEAAASKHKKNDVLPLHPELVTLLKLWIQGLNSGDKLFPNLEKRKTWLMVKTDLQRIGIAYKNEDGIADFHAAGRHSHITHLLRNGASVVEAQKLARHSDVRVTMRYTHIGLQDQHRAVGRLPVVHRRCIPAGAEGQEAAGDGNDCQSGGDANPCGEAALGPGRRRVTRRGKTAARGSTPLGGTRSCIAAIGIISLPVAAIRVSARFFRAFLLPLPSIYESLRFSARAC
jgi:integrase